MYASSADISSCKFFFCFCSVYLILFLSVFFGSKFLVALTSRLLDTSCTRACLRHCKAIRGSLVFTPKRCYMHLYDLNYLFRGSKWSLAFYWLGSDLFPMIIYLLSSRFWLSFSNLYRFIEFQV